MKALKAVTVMIVLLVGSCQFWWWTVPESEKSMLAMKYKLEKEKHQRMEREACEYVRTLAPKVVCD